MHALSKENVRIRRKKSNTPILKHTVYQRYYNFATKKNLKIYTLYIFRLCAHKINEMFQYMRC